MGWMVRVSNPVGARFSAHPDMLWPLPPGSCVYRVFPGGKVRPRRDADHSLPSSAWSWESRAISPPTLWATTGSVKETLYFLRILNDSYKPRSFSYECFISSNIHLIYSSQLRFNKHHVFRYLQVTSNVLPYNKRKRFTPIENNSQILYSRFRASWLCINKTQQDATVCRYLFTASLLYMFRASIASIIRSTQNCNCSLWYRSYYVTVQRPSSNVA